MEPQIRIREMTIDDYDEVLALWQSVEGVALGPSDSRQSTARYLQHNPHMSFVAFDGQTLLGAILCGTDGRNGWLRHLAVRESCRKQGVGKALVDNCLAALKAAEIPWCNIFVFADNASGLAFWRKMGWRFMDKRIRPMALDVVAYGKTSQ